MLEIRELTLISILLRTLAAIVIGGIVGYEREKNNHPAGLRTYSLVCLGACSCMMINQYITQVMQVGDPARIGAQVVSGIGFLGAGSIIVTRTNKIKGLTTAAALWASACLGLAVGIGLFEVAVVGVVEIFVVLTLLSKMEQYINVKTRRLDVHVVGIGSNFISQFIRSLEDNNLRASHFRIEIKDEQAGITEFAITVISGKKISRSAIIDTLKQIPDVHYVEKV